MVKAKEIILKEEVNDIKFECSNPSCSRAVFRLNTEYLSRYGELTCPMCFTNDIRVVFLNYKKEERKR